MAPTSFLGPRFLESLGGGSRSGVPGHGGPVLGVGGSAPWRPIAPAFGPSGPNDHPAFLWLKPTQMGTAVPPRRMGGCRWAQPGVPRRQWEPESTSSRAWLWGAGACGQPLAPRLSGWEPSGTSWGLSIAEGGGRGTGCGASEPLPGPVPTSPVGSPAPLPSWAPGRSGGQARQQDPLGRAVDQPVVAPEQAPASEVDGVSGKVLGSCYNFHWKNSPVLNTGSKLLKNCKYIQFPDMRSAGDG